MSLKVYGGFDPVNCDFAIAFRILDFNHQQAHLAIVDDRGRLRYEPPTEANAHATLLLSREEAEALAKFLHDYGLMPKGAEVETPLKAHLADSIAVRDRLLKMVERGKK